MPSIFITPSQMSIVTRIALFLGALVTLSNSAVYAGDRDAVYRDCCLNGASCETVSDGYSSKIPRSDNTYQRSYSCNRIGEKVWATDRREALRLWKMGCLFENPYPGSCTQYLDRIVNNWGKPEVMEELDAARQLGEEFCHKPLYDWKGIDQSGKICVWLADLYRSEHGIAFGRPEKAIATARYGCQVKHHEESCQRLSFYSDTDVSQESMEAAAQQKRADDARRDEVSRKIEEDRRAGQEAERRSDEAFSRKMQQLEQLGQATQGMGRQPPSGFHAPATAGGLAGGGSAGGACGGCASKCEPLAKSCRETTNAQSACYRATACLCQCNLDAGGCGTSTSALQQCVQENTAKAQQLRSQ